ncbi:MAG TPA: valine--tRNA ligase [Patescibacteria group bacterium]|nr:valine--tRNA ligase [Patescibacteria group bacterium]
MDSTYSHKDHEDKIYKLWEESGALNPDTQKNADKSKPPYTILLPPPNANASLHAGHGMFVVEDILVRYHRMLGQPTEWLPGTDHAGFETQYVYEKHLAKQGTSRFQFDRQTLFDDIYQFVQDNSGTIFAQLKKLGFSCDWSRATFMLDDKVVKIVYDTFAQMVEDGMVYRDNYIVNYSPKQGTTFSDLEVTYATRQDPFYYIRYSSDPEIIISTVRPETKFRDTALACNPNDPRYKDLIGKTITFNGLLGPVEMQIIADDEVDMEFGTGIMKVTPAHDAHDFALGKKYDLPVLPLIDFMGKMDFSWYIDSHQSPATSHESLYLERARKYHGKKVAEARKLIVEDMMAEGMIVKVDEKYTHNVAVDYKTGSDIEPMVMPNWFVATKKLAAPAIAAARNKKVQFVPARFEKTYYDWMENIRDWPISRQIVWGIRIPIWYSVKDNPNLSVTFLDKDKNRVTGIVGELLGDIRYTTYDILSGLQSLRAPMGAKYVVSVDSPGEDFLPETDTFDTWFSSGQWPLTTLNYPNGDDFNRFFPTQVLDTMWDILFFWVARMIMFSLYKTGEVPFSTVYLHSMVTDEKGAKMSKSKGNVVNPIELVDKYGADALRMALIAGSAPGNPIALSENKVRGYRNFSNKLWNIGRYITLLTEQSEFSSSKVQVSSQSEDKKLIDELNDLVKKTTENLDNYRFSDAALSAYDFVWNRLASDYLEKTKSREDKEAVFATLYTVFSTCLKLLHPFMPFVTEAIWQEFGGELLITSPWPVY